MLSLAFLSLLLPHGQGFAPDPLPSWRLADVMTDRAQMARLKKLKALELNDAMALTDEQALHLTREEVEETWTNTFRADGCRVAEYGASSESAANKGLLSTMLWSQRGVREGEWIVLIDTSIDAYDGRSIWRIRDMFPVKESEARAEVTRHLKATAHYLAYYWKKGA